MDYQKILTAIGQRMSLHPHEIELYRDAGSAVRSWGSEVCGPHWAMPREVIDANHRLMNSLAVAMRTCTDMGIVKELHDEYRKCLFYTAPYWFDDYLQAVEFDRPADKKFYLPRRCYLKPIVDGYQDILDGNLYFLSASLPKRAGKAVTLDTMLPTPWGFKRMGDIRVGDLVMAVDGYDTVVTDVFPQGKVPVYEVKFSDGATVKTCAEHQWKVKYHSSDDYSERIMTTGEMMEHGLMTGGHHRFAVEYAQPAEFLFRDVPLDPYVLGVLLGDGSFRDGTITLTNFDREVTDYVRSNLPEGDIAYLQNEKRGRWVIKSETRRVDKRGHMLKSRTAEILDGMGLLGKLSHEKHIPADYLYNTSVMRMELLSGLLDTDGYCEEKGIEYSTTSPALRDGVIFLVRSLGGRVNCTERMGRYKKDGAYIETRMNYRLHIVFPAGVNPFKTKRRAERYKPRRKKLYRYIVSITPCGEEYAQCIRVDHPEHLFLVSDYFVPTHNSQLGINFVNMLSGREPDRSTLMEGTGDALVKSFHSGCLEYLQDTESYAFYEIFPEVRLVQTNADMKTFNLNTKSRFPTVMCRSIDSTQVGLSEATNLLYLDDCVEGREEAKNRVRLDQKWEVISGDILGRAIEGTPIIITGTRYSLYDPIGHMQEEAKKAGWNWRAIEIPALDPVTDESNYEFIREGKKVFTTKYFREQREILSAEQFESEFQQQPFEAKGLLFNKDSLNYYFELPVDREPDAIMAVCDTAESGSDSTALVVLKVYGEDVYVDDVVFDNAPPEVTKPECAKMLKKHGVGNATFESNNAGMYYARDVSELCKQLGLNISIRTKRTVSNKQTRIEMASDGIIKRFWFRDASTYPRGSQYWEFMREVTTYTRSGKVPHDDAPDVLSLAENEIRTRIGGVVEVFRRPF